MRRLPTLVSALLTGLLILSAPPPLSAQEEADGEDEWDVTLARGETREIDFTIEEGTWMSVDLSPDGQWVVFDLLGHVYRVPADGGGEAELLTGGTGVAVSFHPRYSPDGSEIAFVSDRGGQNNLWIMNADGSEPRAVSPAPLSRVVEPAWTPDGEYILVRRGSVAPTPGGASGIYMYHRDGGEGIEVVGDQPQASWPSVSNDGRYLYFHVYTGPPGLQGRDALAGHWQVRRKDLQTGRITDITAGTAQQQVRGSSGSAYAAEISPDGRWLAFARRIAGGTISYRGHRFGPRTALWIRDLETGAERVVMDPITVDNAEGIKTLRILPGYDWSEDGSEIVLSQGGKIRRLDVASGEVTTVPFQARVQRTISEMARADFRIDDDPFGARFLRWYGASPDRSQIVFQAVGRIWLAPISGGAPRRLTTGDGPFEFSPSWSPDGTRIAYTTWDGGEGGHVWTIPAAGGTPQQVTTTPSEYAHPVWSPDGSELVVTRGSGAASRHRSATQNPYWDLVRMPSGGGGTETVITTLSGSEGLLGNRVQIARASYGPDGRIYFPASYDPGEGPSVQALKSVRADGSDERVHATIPFGDELVISPSGTRVAFQEGDNVFWAPLPRSGVGGGPVELRKRGASVPVNQLTTEGGLYPRWHSDEVLEFGSGDRFYLHDVANETTDTTRIALEVPQRIPEGTLALTGARIVTLDDRAVHESGTILVEGARITCVGECDPSGADEVIDLAGKTIVPGFVDMHAHHYREHKGLIPRHDFESAIYLAYGVTTNLDNSMWSQNVFSSAELIRAGAVVGPRTFSTGDPLYNGDRARQNELTSYEVAEQNINRLASWGATALKQYLQPKRDQRQWVSDIAREKGLMVTSENNDIPYTLGMIMDGQTGFEHPLTYLPLFRDVSTFLGQAEAVYSPTFIVGGIGPWNEEYFFDESDVWLTEKQQTWLPWRQVIPHMRRRWSRPDTDYSFPFIAQGMVDVIEAGGLGAIGSHGQAHGIGSHWEIWMAASAAGPMGALEVASLHGARFLGAEEDIGSIEVGKLADLVVLNSNPLDDIRNTTDIQYVIQGGIVRDGTTLDEVWPTESPYGEHWWVNPDAWRMDDRPVDYWDRGR